jgi:hypothetical protein
MNEYRRELAGWLATLEGGSPFTRHEGGQAVLAKRVTTLEADIATLEAKGEADTIGVKAARDLLRLLKG